MKGFHPGYMACRRQGLKVFFSLQEPPPGLIWVQSTEDYWLHMVGQTKHRRAHWQWICAQVFNSETNLQIPSDLRKPDAWQSGKKKQRSSRDQDCPSGHLLQPQNIPVSNSKGLQGLAEARHDRGQLLSDNNTKAPSPLCSGSSKQLS